MSAFLKNIPYPLERTHRVAPAISCVMGIPLALNFFAFLLFAAAPSSPPCEKAEAIQKLDAILKRIRNETLKTYQDTDVQGVEQKNAGGSPEINVIVSPYSCLACGCCGEGDVASTFCDADMACLAPIDSVVSLAINRSKITDAGLRHLGGLSQLKELDLSDNAITDEGLKHLADLVNLEKLVLDRTRVTGNGLAHLANLPKLRGISLSGASLTGAGLANLPKLSSLEWFTAHQTHLDDAGMAAFRRTPNLRWLNLQNTQIGDAGLVHLAGLSKLQGLQLGGTKVGDAGLVHLGGLVKLQRLDLFAANVQGEGLRQLENLKNLESLNISCGKRHLAYSQQTVAALAKLDKLRDFPVFEVTWPDSLPATQRQVDISGWNSCDGIVLQCQADVKLINLHGLPKLVSISILDLNRKNSAPIGPSRCAQIDEIRIQDCKSLKCLSILMPQRLTAPDLKSIEHLTLRGVLKAEPLEILRTIQLQHSLSIEAFSDSEPGYLPFSLANSATAVINVGNFICP